jgi:hypothetical protein
MYMTFGGRNTNSQGLEARGTSNIQPHIGVTLGYDIFSTPPSISRSVFASRWA